MKADPDSEAFTGEAFTGEVFTRLESGETNGEMVIKTVARVAVLIAFIVTLPSLITALGGALK